MADTIQVTDHERQMVRDGLVLLRKQFEAAYEDAQARGEAHPLYLDQINSCSDLITRVMGIEVGG